MRSKLLVCLLLPVLVGAQTTAVKKLQGKVTTTNGEDVAAIHVLNITTQRASITDGNGYFSIPASLNDTLVFSAVQFKKKEIVVTPTIFYSKSLTVPLEEVLEALDEVVVRPHNLTGDMARDLRSLDIGPVVSASTLELPNAHVRVPSKSERELFEATSGSIGIPLNPILNGISGRTKMLKKRVERDRLYDRTARVRNFYADSLYYTALKIPRDKTDDFFYFCEVDTTFQKLVDSHDRFRIWEYLKERSALYRENNDWK